jgi:exodeoxyribonuclease VII large subunit
MSVRFFPLSVITKRINELLQPAISKQFWVKAETTSGRERGGAFYCDLIETDAKGKITAKMSCTIWSSELSRIKSVFKDRGMDLVLADGTVVGFLCSLQYSPQYGISLRVIDADPAFAMGEMELKKREIIERLQKEGLFEKNKERYVPMLPLKIGLISSAGSAAYNDFIQTLMPSGYGFMIYLADAMMQGDQTERSVLLALDKLCRHHVELIVIVRGGGSKTDLYFLDNDAIARKIAGCPIPVWTGIGHEIDTSVLDHVANKSFKTPTAVAEELIARFVQMRRQLDESENTLRTVWSFRVGQEKDHIDRAVTGIKNGSRKLLDVTAGSLRERAQTLRLNVQGRISSARMNLNAQEQNLRSRPVILLQFSFERLGSRRQLLVVRAKSVLSRSRGTFDRLEQRFDRDRFLKRIQAKREVLGRVKTQIKNRFLSVLKVRELPQSGLKARFRVERIRQRIHNEQKSLAGKLATLKASSPQRALERGFALVYRQDGQLIRTVHDVRESDKIRTCLADGVVVSEVISKEEKP